MPAYSVNLPELFKSDEINEICVQSKQKMNWKFDFGIYWVVWFSFFEVNLNLIRIEYIVNNQFFLCEHVESDTQSPVVSSQFHEFLAKKRMHIQSID